jgi:hypothetical protein
MKLLLDRIIKECESRNIRTRFDEDTCVYFVSNIIPGVELKLYTTDDAVVFENNFGKLEHVLTFRDLVNVIHFWHRVNINDSNWKEVTQDWKLVFVEFLGTSELVNMIREEEGLSF